jgi:hypothetical protein
VFIQASKFNLSTICKWTDSIFDVLERRQKQGLPVCTALHVQADGGPDCAPCPMTNLMMYGRLWMASGAAVMCVATYAAGLSALGAIEHLWSSLSKNLAGVAFSACVEGEMTSPAMQSFLTDSKRRDKEVKVFNKALDQCSEKFAKVTWASYPIIPKVIYCGGAKRRPIMIHLRNRNSRQRQRSTMSELWGLDR